MSGDFGWQPKLHPETIRFSSGPQSYPISLSLSRTCLLPSKMLKRSHTVVGTVTFTFRKFVPYALIAYHHFRSWSGRHKWHQILRWLLVCSINVFQHRAKNIRFISIFIFYFILLLPPSIFQRTLLHQY
ncbi:hypothetical protein CY34DRAFT_556267 [Suillus luteus UH-Slu-Lm8-n1]|uniref:Uncharacterized protein n=1 Tax=Suillus luteus UH-Slu-Lm8-n1 TaxID=930992 RepID=A0A0D0BQ59_9AGAM|nr:hypothetical protein CY34DRAFT_556267 [Suillus luteus UH-Slu-Lm8-n1]